jgi:hypothetical protein
MLATIQENGSHVNSNLVEGYRHFHVTHHPWDPAETLHRFNCVTRLLGSPIAFVSLALVYAFDHWSRCARAQTDHCSGPDCALHPALEVGMTRSSSEANMTEALYQ